MERRVETELGALAVFDSGSGPPVLCWPSLYLDHRSFDGVLSELSGERHCIVVDGPGHGLSPGPGHDYDMAACARAAMKVLDVLGIDRVDWVGNAWGGHVGARVAIDFPERIASLAAIASPLQPLSRKTHVQKRVLLMMIRLGMIDRVGALLAAAMLSPSATAAMHDHVRRSVREAPRDGLAAAMRSISIHRSDLLPDLHRISCPTIFVAGGDDPMYPPAMAAAQAARIPGAHCETLAGAGHLGPLERPAGTVTLLRSHWAAHRHAA
jgi:pimeloyl-ACP methyl ester carboxylesterase